MDEFLDGIRKLLRDSVFLAFLGLGAGTLGMASAISWASDTEPNRPGIHNPKIETPEQYSYRFEEYERGMAKVGRHAVIRYPWSVSLTFFGFGVCAACALTIAIRNDS